MRLSHLWNWGNVLLYLSFHKKRKGCFVPEHYIGSRRICDIKIHTIPIYMYICVCVWFMFIYLVTHVHATIVVDTWSSSGPGHRLPTPPLPILMRSWLLLTIPCRGICEGSIKHTSSAMLCHPLGPRHLSMVKKSALTTPRISSQKTEIQMRSGNLMIPFTPNPPCKTYILIYIYISYIWYIYIY